MSFRKINDPQECATLLTLIFQHRNTAKNIAEALGTKTVSESGWHVYNHMEHILRVTDSQGNRLFHKHMLPQTDDILERSINLSVGVVDSGLGAGFGINILSDDKEIQKKAETFIKIAKRFIE